MRTSCTRLAGNTRSQANVQNDAGRVADSLSMEHMLLQLKRPPEQEEAFTQLIESQQDPSSPNYHQWLTADEIGQNFGPSQADIEAVTGWLKSHGFTVNSVHPTGMTIDFSGTAGQVRTAFHTEIHNLSVNGAEHIANMSDPMIPEALAAVVDGVVSMHDFMPHASTSPTPTIPSSPGGAGTGGRSGRSLHHLRHGSGDRGGAGSWPDNRGGGRQRHVQHRRLDYISQDFRPFRLQRNTHNGASGPGYGYQ